MDTIQVILEAQPDGTVHLPLPDAMRQGKVAVTAILAHAEDVGTPTATSTADSVQRRKEALKALRALGGLRDVIPDPVAWQRETREDRPISAHD
jgi:hypothetical protein